MLPSAMNALSQPYLSRGLFVKQSFTAIILDGGNSGDTIHISKLRIAQLVLKPDEMDTGRRLYNR
jgi:hypothetical protein